MEQPVSIQRGMSSVSSEGKANTGQASSIPQTGDLQQHCECHASRAMHSGTKHFMHTIAEGMAQSGLSNYSACPPF